MSWLSALWLRITEPITSLPSRLRERFSKRKPRPFRRKQKPYRFACVDEFPDSLEPYKIYLAGEAEHLWAAAMVCPCGCREVIELNLLKQASPCWNVKKYRNGSISLMPSIWRQKGCRSHFFVRHGRIDWC